MKRHTLWLLAAISGPVILTACGGEEAGQQQMNPAAMAVPVNTITVSEERVTGTDTYPGSVVPLQEVELRPQVAGYITNIYVQDGQKVTKGQKLYEIDQSKYRAAYQQSQANLQSARANLARVQKDLERYETLAQKDAIARQQVDYARTDVQTAKSQVAAAEAQVQSVATDLGYSVITAPFSGTIGISQVRVGAQVSPGQPLLNTISSMDPIAVDFDINEQEISRFSGLTQGNQPDSLFTIRLNNGELYPHTGKLLVIDRAIGRRTGTTTVRVQFPNPNAVLVPGMTVTVNVLNQDIGNQLVIPYRAVSEQLGEYFVYVVQGDSVTQQNVQLGTRFGSDIVVREGVKAGDNIVVEGIQKLRQGAKVQVGAPQQAPGAAPQAGGKN
ncbi:efflux RND transporter periplasmic adaptor subunit [Pontibacter akesuensis]|uniref:Membrane fusion protein, multidrug efflux system n=1 Tax=Pontibacter akesuensis TaxID=388950 RepID=A0A1I7G1Q1_9BACT|nr:efflux RND transporter periplasmic adaptor subunit [Pontibacter akesuensis]GHA59311.1 MexE family multidrug efflux RND transporter periplasmic adaptor subunit [Pontibacter akesuensis]SFU42374.1 membrane fusion protein, multidrug efflux system [Pontibacter akesuensis]